MPTRLSSLARLVVLATAATFLVSCKGKEPPGVTCEVTALTVSPPAATVDIGASVTLGGSLSSTNCTPLPTISWSSSAPTVASVSSSGLVTGLATGTATITASAAGRTASAAITVRPVPVASVTLTLSSLQLTVGQNTQATATLRDAGGTVLTGRTVTFSTSSQAVATVTSTGPGTATVVAVSSGTATITAAIDGVSATQVVTVTVPIASIQAFTIANTEGGTSRTITVVPLDAGGAPLANRMCTWTSSLPAVASVSSPGMTTTLSVVASLAVNTLVSITVTCEGTSRVVQFTATPIPVASVIVTHDSTHLAIGERGLARVVLRGAQNQVLNGRQVQWSVSNMARGTVAAGSAWTSCATEGGTCAFTGTKIVRYGANNIFAYRELTGGTPCTNGVFGDPVPGFQKACSWADQAWTTSGTGGLDVTAVGSGAVTLTATPVVNPNNVSGLASVTMVPEFRVSLAETVPAGPAYSIETTDVLTFTNPINLGTFTTQNVYLQVSGGAVVPPSTTSNAAPNVYGYYVVHNEATSYVFKYTAGLKDIYGKSLKNPGQIAYKTVEMDPNYYYRLSSDYANGAGRSLSINPANFECIMAPTNTANPQQMWYTNPDPNFPTHWQLQNKFYGTVRALEAGQGGVPCRMDPAGNFTGQYWYTVATTSNRWRLHSELQALTHALDQFAGSYVPYMAPVGPWSGQDFYFQRISRRP